MEAAANWLWQGIVVAVAAGVLVRVPRSLGATARYRLWWVAMAIVLALPFAFVLAPIGPPGPGVLDAALEMPPPRSLQVRIGAPEWAPVVLASVWVLWIAVAAARVLSALVGLRRARRAAQPFPAARASRLTHWSAVSTSGRRAALVMSQDVRYAAVLGGRAPMIAVSPAVAAALEDRDLDRIVVHEWAHVQRRDDRARLVQVIVRAVAGLHPGVWWLDRQIHIDRETACDDWAVNVTGSAKSVRSIADEARGDRSRGPRGRPSTRRDRVVRPDAPRDAAARRSQDDVHAAVGRRVHAGATGALHRRVCGRRRAADCHRSRRRRRRAKPRCQRATVPGCELHFGILALRHPGTVAPCHSGTFCAANHGPIARRCPHDAAGTPGADPGAAGIRSRSSDRTASRGRRSPARVRRACGDCSQPRCERPGRSSGRRHVPGPPCACAGCRAATNRQRFSAEITVGRR